MKYSAPITENELPVAQSKAPVQSGTYSVVAPLPPPPPKGVPALVAAPSPLPQLSQDGSAWNEKPLPRFSEPAAEPVAPRIRHVNPWLVRVAAAGLVAGIGLTLGLGPWLADRVPPKAEDLSVLVRVGNTFGSGFFIRDPQDAKNVLLVTSYSLLQTSPSFGVQYPTSPGQAVPRTIYPELAYVGVNESADVAVVRVSGAAASDTKAVEMSSPEPLPDSVAVVGYVQAESTRPIVTRTHGLSLLPSPNAGTSRTFASAQLPLTLRGATVIGGSGRIAGIVLPEAPNKTSNLRVVSTDVIRALLTTKPISRAPTSHEVKALLARIENDYLAKSVDERLAQPLETVVARTDLPHLAVYAKFLNSGERSIRDDARTELSSDAWFNLLGHIQFPASAIVRHARTSSPALASCSHQELSFHPYLGTLELPTMRTAGLNCDQAEVRLLGWSLLEGMLMRLGQSASNLAVEVSSPDEYSQVYRIRTKSPDGSPSETLWTQWESSALKLRLFDPFGQLHANASTPPIDKEALTGVWIRQRLAENASSSQYVMVHNDRLEISVSDSAVPTVSYSFHTSVSSKREGARFSCNQKSTVSDSGRIVFQGRFNEKYLLATTSNVGAPSTDCIRCRQCALRPVAMVACVEGPILRVFATDGRSAPEEFRFERGK